MEHLAIMDKLTIEKILNGEKLIESRFSKNKIAPYRKVKINDIVYLKAASNILASFVVKEVIYFEELTNDKIREIKLKYGQLINAPEEYWDIKSDSSYGTLIYIKNPRKINLKINKKDRAAFVSSNDLFLRYKVEKI